MTAAVQISDIDVTFRASSPMAGGLALDPPVAPPATPLPTTRSGCCSHVAPVQVTGAVFRSLIRRGGAS